MNFLICSDLHLEFLNKNERQIFFLPLAKKCENIILAGDFSCFQYLQKDIKLLTNHFKNVLFVPGNHEYYNSSFQETDDLLNNLTVNIPNFHLLNNNMISINGINFIGSTLWFPELIDNILHEKRLSDFKTIKDFKKEIYNKNAESVEFLKNTISEGDVVIIHHLPSYRSVSNKYKTSDLNRFFVCNMEKLIEEKNPKIWIHILVKTII